MSNVDIYIHLGWKLSWTRLVGLSWGGLDEAARGDGPVSYLRVLPVVTAERAARREVLRYGMSTSPKKVDLLARAIGALRCLR